jgi:hypothetical protein
MDLTSVGVAFTRLGEILDLKDMNKEKKVRKRVKKSWLTH